VDPVPDPLLFFSGSAGMHKYKVLNLNNCLYGSCNKIITSRLRIVINLRVST
jgi:hypothetical protein